MADDVDNPADNVGGKPVKAKDDNVTARRRTTRLAGADADIVQISSCHYWPDRWWATKAKLDHET